MCMESGVLENLCAISIGSFMFLLSIPLILDVFFLLMQRVHPQELVGMMKKELVQLQDDWSILEPIKWHLWSLDKS